MNASDMLRRYLKGQNVTVEYHWLEGQYDRLPALMADLVRRRVAVIATPAGNLCCARGQSCDHDDPDRLRRRPKTRSSLVLSPASTGRAATRPASIFSPRRWWPSGWDFCMSWCPRPFAIAVLVNPANVPAPRARYETYRKLHVPSDCKFRSSTPAPGARSRQPSPLSCATGPTPSSSPPTRSSPAGASNLRRSRRVIGFPRSIPLARLSRSAG